MTKEAFKEIQKENMYINNLLNQYRKDTIKRMDDFFIIFGERVGNV